MSHSLCTHRLAPRHSNGMKSISCEVKEVLSLHPRFIFFLALFFEVFAAHWENEILDNACVKKTKNTHTRPERSFMLVKR